MILAQAQTIECDGRRFVVTFPPALENAAAAVRGRRGELEGIAQQLAGTRVPVTTARGVAPSPGEPPARIAAPRPTVEPAPT
jgi:hypothetical protein